MSIHNLHRFRKILNFLNWKGNTNAIFYDRPFYGIIKITELIKSEEDPIFMKGDNGIYPV